MTEDEPADNCEQDEPQEVDPRGRAPDSFRAVNKWGSRLLNKSCFKMFGANSHC